MENLHYLRPADAKSMHSHSKVMTKKRGHRAPEFPVAMSNIQL